MTFSPRRLVLALILGAVAVKVVLSFQLELTSVESYLWVCAQHPSLGYYDYPGMSPWLIALSTSLFGGSVAGVRALSILAGAGTAWMIYLAGRRLYDERTGALAGALAAVLPLFFVFGAQAAPDAPLLFFWAATVWALAHALSGDSPRWWTLAGLFLGLATESKYHGVFLGAGVLLFLAASSDHRRWLKRKEPWLAALVALAAFAPTIVWNAGHDWASFRYQGVGRFGERPFRASELLSFPMSQLGLLTPVAAVLAWVAGFAVFRRGRDARWQDKFLAAVGMPVLLFFVAVMFTRTVRGHWPAPAYVTLVLLACGAGRGTRWLEWTVAAMALVWLAVPGAVALTPPEWRDGWGRLAAEVAKRKPDFVIGREYHLTSQLGYHLRPVPAVEFTAVGRPSKGFRYWWRRDLFVGKDAVVVLEPEHAEEELPIVARAFQRLEPPERVEVVRFKGRRETFLLVRARGYRGP